MKPLIKICGINDFNILQQLVSIDSIDYLGFIFYEKSVRNVSPEFLEQVKEFEFKDKRPVCVYVNSDKDFVKETSSYFKDPILQFHGDENQEFCSSFNLPFIKAISMNEKDYMNQIFDFDDAFAILLDSGGQKIRGGTGKTFDWKLIPKEIKNNLIIAGGLNSNNITTLIKNYVPYGIDLASGVESRPGKKDIAQLEYFLKIVDEI